MSVEWWVCGGAKGTYRELLEAEGRFMEIYFQKIRSLKILQGAKLPLKGTIKMRKIMANCFGPWFYAFKSPVWTVSYLVSVVCLSLFPALQMEAVTRLVEHLGQSQDEVLPLALGVLCWQGYIALRQASDSQPG